MVWAKTAKQMHTLVIETFKSMVSWYHHHFAQDILSMTSSITIFSCSAHKKSSRRSQWHRRSLRSSWDPSGWRVPRSCRTRYWWSPHAPPAGPKTAPFFPEKGALKKMTSNEIRNKPFLNYFLMLRKKCVLVAWLSSTWQQRFVWHVRLRWMRL